MLELLGFIGLVLAIVALRRTRGYPGRLAALEREVQELRRLVGGAPRGQGADTPTAAPPAAAPEPVAPRTPEPWSDVPPPIPPREAEAPRSAPPPRPAPPPEEPPPPGSPAGIDWERWLGVRGAAVLGGIALALAGLLFFKYSVEHGLFPPWLRVVTGVLVGIGAITAAEWRLRGEFTVTANALAGAGIVLLYASFWAASALYGLVGMTPGFVLMVAVTAACCALAWRHASLVIALLGLVGGFATPLLLSSGSDRPLGLFGYVLLLDLALLVLAQRRHWPMLALLSLAGTVFYQAVWIGTRMGPSRLGLGLGILGVFALLFTVVGRLIPPEDRKDWRMTQAAAVLVPFAFVLYLAVDARFPPHLHQVAMLLVLLSAAAGWLARVQGPPALALGAASASVAVMAVWVVRDVASGRAWQVAMWSCAIAAVFHVFVEREPERDDRDGPSPPAALAALGFFVLLIVAAAIGRTIAPWLLGFAGLAALLLRHGSFPGRERLHWAAALGVALGLTVLRVVHGLTVLRVAHGSTPWFPTPEGSFAILIAAALAFQGAALLPHAPPARREAEQAAALLPVALLVSLVDVSPQAAMQPVLFLGSTLILGLLAALAAMRLGTGPWLLAAMAATALVHHAWTAQVPAGAPAPLLVGALLLETLAVVAFTASPFLAANRFRADAYAWPAAALAGPAWFLALRRLYTLRFGDEVIGILPLALGGLALLTVVRARRVWAADDPRRTAGLAWFAAVALSFATVAIPLQLEREWITIGWALEGLAVIVLWTRLDHPGLKYFGLALLGAATIRLVANPAVLGYYPRPAWRIVNWLLYTYLVPAAALLGASRVLGQHELERARPWERSSLYGRGWPVGALAAGLAGLALVFVWINLAIADWFATGETLVVSFERLPARDLTMSMAWAFYALVLLGIGMAQRSIGLRWVSLGLLLVTIAKVFLYDLGELRDLYRVASLLGLAISLMLVSVAYQRFVFRSPPMERS